MVESLSDIYNAQVPIESIVNIKSRMLVEDLDNNLLNFNMSMIDVNDKKFIALRSTDFRPPTKYAGKLSYISTGHLEGNKIIDASSIRLNGYGIRLWDKYNSMEDPRLIEWRGDVWCLFTRPNFYISNITMGMVNLRTMDWTLFDDPKSRDFSKNWMPYVHRDKLYLVTDTDPFSMYEVVDNKLEPVIVKPNKMYNFDIHGSSNVIDMLDRRITLIHGREMSGRTWTYWHRFISWNDRWEDPVMGKPFFFEKKGVEFSLCLLKENDCITIPYSVDDESISILKIDNQEFGKLL
jgi:hypothetical protein